MVGNVEPYRLRVRGSSSVGSVSDDCVLGAFVVRRVTCGTSGSQSQNYDARFILLLLFPNMASFTGFLGSIRGSH